PADNSKSALRGQSDKLDLHKRRKDWKGNGHAAPSAVNLSAWQCLSLVRATATWLWVLQATVAGVSAAMLICAATAFATEMNASETGCSGLTAVSGLPSSPPVLSEGSIGISPRNGTPCSSARRAPPP